uniref:NADH-ubiquinone oxidoreductase chain 6 n=1 Tax=Spinolyprops cribricollis TaxID=2984372 RepID=A0A978AZ02_9CUCU|nr:NADH dehydrogenase subunit 6 [Spinolyprops cribricollis]UYB79066.1 NADH dehydrogenase subunit 6 [Spinolyprops cribricollis]
MTILIYISSSILFILVNHPLSMGLILLIQTFMTSLMTNYLSTNFWYSYIIMLIMIGGMLILFIYMTSVASNEKFKFSPKMMLFIPLTLMLSLMYEIGLKYKFYSSEMLKFNMTNDLCNPMIKFINFPFILILLFTIIFLFIILVASVKISKKSKGPLRQMFN